MIYDGWKLFNDEMPQEGDEVLVCYEESIIGRFCFVAQWRKDTMRWCCGRDRFVAWIHKNDIKGWIPLSAKKPDHERKVVVWYSNGTIDAGKWEDNCHEVSINGGEALYWVPIQNMDNIEHYIANADRISKLSSTPVLPPKENIVKED